MERTLELALVIGIIFISAYALKINNEAINSMNMMNRSIQMMFVKS